VHHHPSRMTVCAKHALGLLQKGHPECGLPTLFPSLSSAAAAWRTMRRALSTSTRALASSDWKAPWRASGLRVCV
jgi:hypothetical protein